MGIHLEKQGQLYWFQERSIMREYQYSKMFQAKMGGINNHNLTKV